MDRDGVRDADAGERGQKVQRQRPPPRVMHRPAGERRERGETVLDGERRDRQDERAGRHCDAPPVEGIGVVLVAPDALEHRRDVDDEAPGKRRVEDAGMRGVPRRRVDHAVHAGEEERRARRRHHHRQRHQDRQRVQPRVPDQHRRLAREVEDRERDQRKGERHRHPGEDRQRRTDEARQARLRAEQRPPGRRPGAGERRDDQQRRRIAWPEQQQHCRGADDRQHLEDRPDVDERRRQPRRPGQIPGRRTFDAQLDLATVASHEEIERTFRAEPVGIAPAAHRLGGVARLGSNAHRAPGQEVLCPDDDVALAQAGRGRGARLRHLADGDVRAEAARHRRPRHWQARAGHLEAGRAALERRAVSRRREIGTDRAQLDQQRRRPRRRRRRRPASRHASDERGEGPRWPRQSSDTPGKGDTRARANTAASGRRWRGRTGSGSGRAAISCMTSS